MPPSGDTPRHSSGINHRWMVVYVMSIVAALLLFLAIRHVGESFDGGREPAAANAPVSTVVGHDAIYHVLIALVAIIAAGRVLTFLFSFVGQPPVIGEVFAGILLGPSLLGRLWPAANEFVLPSTVAPYLRVLSQLGVILYMFLVGLELNAEFLRNRARATVAISHASIVAPFLLGAALALGLFRQYAPQSVGFTSFALFLGVAMSVTAFPVLARILTDRRMERTEFGVIALCCAAVGDVTAWCLLAIAVGVANAQVSQGIAVASLSLLFITGMLLLVRPIARRTLDQDPESPLSRRLVTWVFVAVLLSSLATEWIGIHAIFGAFLLGAVIPHDSAVARSFRAKLEDVVSIVLLPAFFAYTGMRTQIGLVSTPSDWFACALLVLVATLGKFGGSYAAARISGLDHRTSASVGVLMNARGLMELIVLNVGLDLGIITPTLFAMMVLMALITTVATTPALAWFQKQPSQAIPQLT